MALADSEAAAELGDRLGLVTGDAAALPSLEVHDLVDHPQPDVAVAVVVEDVDGAVAAAQPGERVSQQLDEQRTGGGLRRAEQGGVGHLGLRLQVEGQHVIISGAVGQEACLN